MTYIIIISYIIIIFLVYTILRFMKTDEDSELHMLYSIFWPVIIITIIILGPFELIDTLAKKSKEIKRK